MLVNRAESHTSGARFVSQPARLPEPLPKKDDTANLTEFYLQLCFLPKPKNFMRTETPAKKDELYFELKQLLKRENILCWPKRLLKKSGFYFYQNLCKEKTSRFWRPSKTNHEQSRSRETKPIKTTANRNASQKPWSRFQRLGKTNLNLCQRRNHRQTKMLRTWKPACWKDIDQMRYLKKSHR